MEVAYQNLRMAQQGFMHQFLPVKLPVVGLIALQGELVALSGNLALIQMIFLAQLVRIVLVVLVVLVVPLAPLARTAFVLALVLAVQIQLGNARIVPLVQIQQHLAHMAKLVNYHQVKT
jgi:hypothetical protein